MTRRDLLAQNYAEFVALIANARRTCSGDWSPCTAAKPDHGPIWLTTFHLYDGGQDDDTLRPEGFTRSWEVCAPNNTEALRIAVQLHVEPLGAEVLNFEVEPTYPLVWGDGYEACT